jgi:hypothetical protein
MSERAKKFDALLDITADCKRRAEKAEALSDYKTTEKVDMIAQKEHWKQRATRAEKALAEAESECLKAGALIGEYKQRVVLAEARAEEMTDEIKRLKGRNP